MKIEKAGHDNSSFTYSAVIRTDKGLIVIWFTSVEDRTVGFHPDIGPMNCIFLCHKDEHIITGLWDTQADEFRAAFAKLTEETDNA
jgi:hypothetical protein